MQNTRKNIVFINPGQLGYRAGYYYYAKYLSSYDYYRIYFVCLNQGYRKCDLERVKAIYIDSSGNRYLRNVEWIIGVCKIIRKFRNSDSVFFVSYFRGCSIVALLFHRKRVILDIRTGSVSPNAFVNRMQNLTLQLITRLFRESVILSVELMKYLKIDPTCCSYIPLGADSLSTREKEFEELHLLYVGALGGRRIYETIQGLWLFINRNMNCMVSYDIFGYGTERDIEKIVFIIHKYNLDNIVSYHGMKNHEELGPYFEKCNIGISYVPITKYYDLQPATKTYEYILSGLACIATDTYENRKVINDQNGVLCRDNAESFAYALEVLARRRGEFVSSKIREAASMFSWENIVKSYLKPLLDR